MPGTDAPALDQHVVLTGADGALRTERAAVDSMLDAIAERGRGVIHFHGGLVPEKRGLETAASLLPVYSDAGAYPVFFVWRSGLGEIATGTLLRDIAEEAVFKQLLKRLLRFAVGVLTEQAGARALGSPVPDEAEAERELRRRDAGEEPFAERKVADDVGELTPADEQTLELELMNDFELQAALQAALRPEGGEEEEDTAKGMRVGATPAAPTRLDPDAIADLRADIPGEGEKGLLSTAALVAKAVRILSRVVERFRTRRDHGIYPTVVEEILREFYLATAGAAVWQAMKKETLDTFAQLENRGGDYFLRGLGELLEREPDTEITLVGHSTGAVFINNLMEAVEARRQDEEHPFPADFRFKHVVFLAPACTFTDFARVVERWDGLWDDFRMFTMTDDAECRDALVPVVYPRSLLYFVSGVLERDPEGKSEAAKPIVGLARWYDREFADTPSEVERVRRFVRDEQRRVVWSPAEGDAGLTSSAVSHGAFDEDEQVRASLRAIIANEDGA